MRAVLTRVLRACVRVEKKSVGSIGSGICAFVGIGRNDTPDDALWLANKLVRCRFFEDTNGKMNHSVRDVGGSVLVVSQFTLYGDLRRGTRPSFNEAMRSGEAKVLFDQCCQHIREQGVEVASGRFGADMQVESVNNGPITLIVDSTNIF